MPCPCRSPAMLCHAAPLQFSDSAVSFVKVRVVAGNIRAASPTVSRIGMLMITNFVELRVVAGRSRTRAGRLQTASGGPTLIHTCHDQAAPTLSCAVALRCFQKGMVVAWHGHSMAGVNQTRSHCINQMGKTQSKPLAARHGRGTAWYVTLLRYHEKSYVNSTMGSILTPIKK
jgi:hypothetical protein